ncbi:MAG: efflux RND transporter permease subunit [Candidatus Atribacteria bacterium]|nr:efflux RND transporter permease subunit [Candidatus Atribacteria bacterium]
MNLPKLSVSRPVTILMLFIGLIVIGLISYQGLGLDLLPDMSFPVSAVLVSYPGVAPEEIETLITIPLEEVLSTLQSLDSITSYSQESSSIILLSFQWGTNMDIATLEIREKIDQVKRILPEGASAPMVFKFDPTIMPVMMLAMNSERYDLDELQKFAQDLVKPQLERLEGIARATVSGGLEREILVSVDNEKLRANNLTLAQVIASLGSENINLPAGTLREGNIDLLVRTLGRFKNLEDIEKVVLYNMQGRQIYLTEVAQVIDTYKERDVIAYINGLPSISFNLQKESGSNTVLVANRVYQELEKIKDLLPHEVEITVAYDSSDFIKKAISQVVNVGLTGALLAVIVLFLFLRSLKSTLIISLAIPISIISTFILLYFSNLTLNMMTMGGLALGVGMLVDNAIVVLENIFRHHQLGEEAPLAADYGANEVSNAIIASTLTTIAVFLPVIYVSGIAGELFKTMGLTITFSLLMSLFVALTLIPMLSSRLMKNEKVLSPSMANPGSNFKNKSSLSPSGGLFNFVKKEYGSLIKWSLRHRGIVVIGAIVIFMVSLSLIPIVGTEFMPSVDQGMFNINISLPVGTNLAVTEEVIRTVEGIASEIPEVRYVFSIVGGGGMGMNQSTSSGGTIMVTLVDQRERERSTKEIIADLRTKVGEFPDTTINFGEQGVSLVTGSPLSIKITGDSLSELEYIADTVISLLSEIEGVYDLQSSIEEVLPELHIDIDREKANLYGLTTGQIATTIQNALLGKVAGYYLEEGEQYDITVKLARGNVEQISELENLVISSAYGLQVPLKEVAAVKTGAGPQAINREKQQRQVTVTGSVSGRVLGEVIQDAQQQLASLVLPEGYHYTFSGEYEQMTESFSDLFFALILSILLVFMIIAAQFESLLFPFAVIFSIPFALIGVIIALLLARTSLNILVLLGFIMLAGIVVNNAIVLIDYINQLRQRGIERNEAVVEGGETRLRPILMTTLTTILGLVPMALGIGEGAELRAPLAVAIIGGLTSSTFLTLIIIPIFYTYLDDLAKKLHLQF